MASGDLLRSMSKYHYVLRAEGVRPLVELHVDSAEFARMPAEPTPKMNVYDSDKPIELPQGSHQEGT